MEKRFYLSKLKVMECEKKFKEKFTHKPLYGVVLIRNKRNEIYIEPDLNRYSPKVYLAFTKKNDKTLIEARFKKDISDNLGKFFFVFCAILFFLLLIKPHEDTAVAVIILVFLGGMMLLGCSASRFLKKHAWNMVENYIINELQSEKTDNLPD